MPAIDLARLRKQSSRLADFFFLPNDFLSYLREMLEFYVNHSLRSKARVAPGSNLSTYRTPPEVLRQIETQLQPLAVENPGFALDLADILWEQGNLESSLLAVFLLGQLPPQEILLLARITAWAEQARDPSVRAELLSTGTARMRRESLEQFLGLVREWLHPERPRTWSNGLRALVPLIADISFDNLPPVLDLVEPILRNPQARLQSEIEDLIIALHRASPRETTYFLKQILKSSANPLTSATLRRISPALPSALESEIREALKPGQVRTQSSASPEGE